MLNGDVLFSAQFNICFNILLSLYLLLCRRTPVKLEMVEWTFQRTFLDCN